MAEDGQGAIWLSYWNSASLRRIKDGKVQTIDAAASPSGEGVTMLTGDSRG